MKRYESIDHIFGVSRQMYSLSVGDLFLVKDLTTIKEIPVEYPGPSGTVIKFEYPPYNNHFTQMVTAADGCVFKVKDRYKLDDDPSPQPRLAVMKLQCVHRCHDRCGAENSLPVSDHSAAQFTALSVNTWPRGGQLFSVLINTENDVSVIRLNEVKDGEDNKEEVQELS